MKLLFDQNISYRIVPKIEAIFPLAKHISQVGFANANDVDIWLFAKNEGFVIVTFDTDYFDISLINGCPPKIIWLRTGNISTRAIIELILSHQGAIADFVSKPEFVDVACLEITGI
jgi:predicted nuclease of predicted toxin-antitoxin system